VIIEIESFDPEREEVRFRTQAGVAVTGRWGVWYPPTLGAEDVEFDSDPTCVWGTDVVYAPPDEPDAITQDEDGYVLVGQVEGPITPHDVRAGIFHLRIFGSLIILAADRVDADAAGRRVRVRQKTLAVFPS